MFSDAISQQSLEYTRLETDADDIMEHNLPPYSRRAHASSSRREPMEHKYTLTSGRSKAWATLTLKSSAKTQKSLPTFYRGEDILGSLDLSLERGDAILGINVSVKGRIITGANCKDSYTFFEHTQTLWSKATAGNEPRSTSGMRSSNENTKDAKLYGDYTWPIRVQLPRRVNLPTGAGDFKAYRLPQTFMERSSGVSVQYDFAVHISRTKLHNDYQLGTPIAFVPCTRPEAPSILRSLAYQQGTPAPGPSSDPEGWKASSVGITRGTVFNSHRVGAKCKLHVAAPSNFTRGSSIPVVMDIECQDRQALECLIVPSAINVRLRRKVRYYVANGSGKTVGWQEEIVDDTCHPAAFNASRTTITPVGNAFEARLEGDITLPKDLKPTTDIAHLSVSYYVTLLPFESHAFRSVETSALIEEPVSISTMYCKTIREPEYRPTPSPPDYDLHGCMANRPRAV